MNENTKLYNLTTPQKSIWLTEQFHEGTAISNVCGTLNINGSIDVELFKRAINVFVQTHDATRIKLVMDNGTPKQYIEDYTPFDIEIIDIENESDLSTKEQQLSSTPFERYDAPLYKFTLFRFPNGNYSLNANFHHVISDAWSMKVLGDQLMDTYMQLQKGEQLDITQDNSYLNYIAREKEFQTSDKYKKSQTYWDGLFDKMPGLASLRLSNNSTSSLANRQTFELSQDQTAKLKELGRSTLSTLIGLYSLYISRATNLSDVTVGTPILNRINPSEKNTFGMFINTLPVKTNVDESASFKNYLSTISQQLLNLLRHQQYQYDYIIQDVRKKHDSSSPLYDISLSYQNARLNHLDSDLSFSTNWIFNGTLPEGLDIHVTDMDDTGKLHISYDYLIDCFKTSDISMLHNRFLHVLNTVIENPDIKLEDIEVITDTEKQKLQEYNNTKSEYLNQDSVLTSIENQAKISPDKIALDNGREISYQELIDRKNALACKLIRDGVKENDSVVIACSNSPELIISILATLTCGAHYVPIDTSYPPERIKYIIQDANPSKVLTNSSNIDNAELINMDIIDELPNDTNVDFPDDNLDRLAYILYTSGSTGNPKGVKIKHSSLANYINFANKKYVNNEKSNFALFTSIGFDLTVTSIFTPLVSGNKMYIYNDDSQLNIERTMNMLPEIVANRDLDVVKLTPSHLQLLTLLDLDGISINKLILGGENLSKSLCETVRKKFGNDVRIFNEYGPTEATVGCMIYEYDENDNYTSVPIGIPIDNSEIYILDSNHNIVPPEYSGEMYIAGDCLGDGYLNLDEMTAKSFIYSEKLGKLLYKTGDIAHFTDDYNLIYNGRIGNQIKSNGFRIELEEIKSVIENFPGISECLIKELQGSNSNNSILCAYIVSSEEVNENEIKDYIKQYLPSYMVPKHIIQIDKMPLDININGKSVDNGLPNPQLPDDMEYIAPKTDVEKDIASILCILLKIQKISITADLSSYSIDSYTVAEIHSMLVEKGYNISLQQVFEAINIESLAAQITSKEDTHIIDNNLISNINEYKHPISHSPNGKKSSLVAGANGFLGMHVIHSLLEHTDNDIICMLRSKDIKDVRSRFIDTYTKYFGKEDLMNYYKRLKVVNADVTKQCFGLNDTEYQSFGHSIEDVFNCAAAVQHYGKYSHFKPINVDAVQNIIDFCTKFNLPMNHVSTMSVSGYGLTDVPSTNFDENSLYIGQDYLANPYVRSKFEAELSILNGLKDGLVANIYRVGNLSPRYSDGTPQENFHENAFINRLLSLINMRNLSRRVIKYNIRIHTCRFMCRQHCKAFVTKSMQHQLLSSVW